MIAGHERAIQHFNSAWKTGAMHHAWLLAGPRGIGKAHFARSAARRVLAEAAGPAVELPGLDTPDDHPIARLVAAGSHPDLRSLQQLEHPKTGNLARNITVDQVRGLADLIGSTPFLSPWRSVIIDSADVLEQGAANALLKMLEEPPANTIFFLVAHAPGRLLPTIRSRCRRLDFGLLPDDAMTSILETQLPDMPAPERARIVSLAGGAVGRAMAFAAFDLAGPEQSAMRILREGDPSNARRSALATELGKKRGADRYAAFLELMPSLLAREARHASRSGCGPILDAYEKARSLAAIAPRLSLDPAATVFQMAGILASVSAAGS